MAHTCDATRGDGTVALRCVRASFADGSTHKAGCHGVYAILGCTDVAPAIRGFGRGCTARARCAARGYCGWRSGSRRRACDRCRIVYFATAVRLRKRRQSTHQTRATEAPYR
eukprot:5136512-Prymnesium_polylepis.1